MGQANRNFLATRPLPAGRLWLAIGIAWLSSIGAVLFAQELLAIALTGMGFVLIATLGMPPIPADAPDALSRRVRAAQPAAGEGDARKAGSGSREVSRPAGAATVDTATRGDELGAAAQAGVRRRDRRLRPLRRQACDHCQHRGAGGHRADPGASGEGGRRRVPAGACTTGGTRAAGAASIAVNPLMMVWPAGARRWQGGQGCACYLGQGDFRPIAGDSRVISGGFGEQAGRFTSRIARSGPPVPESAGHNTCSA
jgi:hypothetical protein